MKVTQNQPPIQPKPFYPVSITLETQEEIDHVFSFLMLHNDKLCPLGKLIKRDLSAYQKYQLCK